MKRVVTTGLSIAPLLSVVGVHADPPRLPSVPLPADNSQATGKIQPGERLLHDTHLSSTDDISYGICRDRGNEFTDSLFKVSGDIRKRSYISPTTCISDHTPYFSDNGGRFNA